MAGCGEKDICSTMDDIEFMNYCYKNFDVNKDGKFSKQECEAVRQLDCDRLEITSFKGIEYFANLETFSCEGNTKIKTIDLSYNKKITSIDFDGCKSLTGVILPNSVAEIGNYAFHGCIALINIIIPNGVTMIGKSAFYGCYGLTSIAIPGNVTTIGDNAFYGCTALKNITIPDSVASIGEYAFFDCAGLTRIIIGKGVTEIGERAFDDCTNLIGVYITDIAAWCSIKFAGYNSNPLSCAHNLYLNGNAVYDLLVPYSVTKIDNYAFDDCERLRSITISDNVTTIGEWAFSGCTLLKSITIGKGVKSIGYPAFYGCTNLKSVYCMPTIPPTLSDCFFYYWPSDAKIYVPRASVDTYKSAPHWKDYASQIVGYDF